MKQVRRTNVLYYIICGGPPASNAAIFVRLAQAADWDVCVVATPQARNFINAQSLQQLIAYPIRSDYKMPQEADVLPQANAIVIAPMTFNTMNKWVCGIADTLAVSLLSEYLGLNVPIIAAPNINPALARHPIMQENLAKLESWGINVLFEPSAPPPTWMVSWQRILAELGKPAPG